MPYRIDLTNAPADALDRLVNLGALDVEMRDNAVAALLPDDISSQDVARELAPADVRLSPAVGRDEDSVWVLSPRATTVAGLSIVPASAHAVPGTLRLADGPAFGTGQHPTTALCLEAIREAIDLLKPETVLDVGTGSGVLALAALMMGVREAVAVDTDAAAITAATENARINALSDRLRLVHGGPDGVTGQWPLVVANILAAPLMDMAPVLVQRVGHGGSLILSGIPSAVAPDIERVYVRLGMRRRNVTIRAGWSAIVVLPSW